MTKRESRKNDQSKRLHRLVNRGASLLREGRAEEAIIQLERANQLDADSVPTLINLAGAYIMTGKHRKAIPLLEAARSIEPGNAMIYVNLGAAYLGNPLLATPEQQLQAIKAFETALQLNPAAPSVHYNLGLIFVDRGETDLAVAAFHRAVQVNPLDRDAQQWLRKLQDRDQEPKEGK